jgi:hypothetical protein
MLATEEVTEAMAVEAFKRTSSVTHSDAMGTSAPLGRFELEDSLWFCAR